MLGCLQGPVWAILSQTTVPDRRPATPPTLTSNKPRLTGTPHVYYAENIWSFWKQWAQSLQEVPSQFQKCSPQSSTARHRPNTAKCADIKEPEGDRNGLSNAQWEGLLAEHLPSLQGQAFKMCLYIQQKKKKIQFSGLCWRPLPPEEKKLFSWISATESPGPAYVHLTRQSLRWWEKCNT